jgi:hypothetical protein
VSPSRMETTGPVKSAAMTWEITRDTKRREHERERRVEKTAHSLAVLVAGDTFGILDVVGT